jgi:integrator complex subunit 11
MTYPTKAMLPLMLEDFHKVVTSRGGGGGGGGKEGENSNSNNNNGEISFSRADIDAASRAAVAVPLHATVPIAGGKLTLRAFYAGHVLGAAMFEVRAATGGSRDRGFLFGDKSGSLLAVDGASVLYSGDYNMTPDRHLGPARPLRTRPDVFITESTYATTVRGPKKQREREFLDAVVSAVRAPRAGKVLVPVFALGRAQELMCLIEDHWSALGLWQSVPVFYSAGMVRVWMFCFFTSLLFLRPRRQEKLQ